MTTSSENGITRLLSVVARLRGPGGCPWDREQTLASLKPYLIEETYEVLEALDSGDSEWHKEELGDVLLQVVLHAQIRSENGEFDFDAVASSLADKLIRRHPHVFGDAVATNTGDVLRRWEKIKATEKKDERTSAVDGIPVHLPALQRAQRVQSRASRVGFDWNHVSAVMDKVEEELGEMREAMAAADAERTREEIGDLLFSIVNLCRFQDVDAEEALRATVAKFVRRFRQVERRVDAQGRAMTDCSMDELDALWDAVKKEERTAPPAP